MKTIATILSACLFTSAAIAQQTTTPRSTNNGGIRIVNPDNSTGAYRSNPQPGQTAPVEQPSGQLKTTNPFGSQTTQPQGTEPLPSQSYNDYQLTQPSTSPTRNMVNQGPPTNDPVIDTNKGLMEVDHSQLPNVMIDALKDPKYQGWEATPIYIDPKTNEFLMDMKTDDQIRRFRFDQRGYPIEVDDSDDQ